MRFISDRFRSPLLTGFPVLKTRNITRADIRYHVEAREDPIILGSSLRESFRPQKSNIGCAFGCAWVFSFECFYRTRQNNHKSLFWDIKRFLFSAELQRLQELSFVAGPKQMSA